MKDPERILSSLTANRGEHALLASVGDVSPPAGAEAEVWAELLERLPAAAAGASAGGATAGLVKSGFLGLVVGVIVAGTAVGLRPRSAPPEHQTARGSVVHATEAFSASQSALESPTESDHVRPSEVSSSVTPNVARVAAPDTGATEPIELPAEESPRSNPTASFPAVAADPEVAQERRRSQLREESRLLREARAALRAGNAVGALSILSTAQQKHNPLVLWQEHEALSIEALAASGASAEAQRRALVFVTRFPNSPHADRLRSIAGLR